MAHDTTGLCWQHGTRTSTIQFQGPQLCQFLPENYPHPTPFKSLLNGCTMPDSNPDLPWLIRRHRDDHVAFWKEHAEFGPHRLEDAEAVLTSAGSRDVVLIAGGWSAGENMALVRRWIGLKKPIVIAVNRAAVCWPDADAFFITERQSNPHWWKHANKSAVCVVAPSTNPEVLKHFAPTQFAYFVTPWCFHDKWENAPEWVYKPPMVSLPACETTMSMALAWTVRLKPKRVILLGVDHCWPAYTVNHENVWVPGPYYCDGYPWNGPDVGRRVRRGINGRFCVSSEVGERQVRVLKTALEQIQINSALPEPLDCINASGHGILDWNVDNLLFMRELDESEAKDKAETADRLLKERSPDGLPETVADVPSAWPGLVPVSAKDNFGGACVRYSGLPNQYATPQVSGPGFPRSATVENPAPSGTIEGWGPPGEGVS